MSTPPSQNLPHYDPSEIDAQKRRAARLAVTSNGILTVLKLIVVGFTGSVSVLAETINSAGDLLGSAVAFTSVRAADTPPDHMHTYGHGKFENLSGILIALLIIVGAAYACTEAVQHLIQHTPVHGPGPAIVVMGISALANTIVSRRLLFVGKKYDSPALLADGKHLQSDILTSASAFVGLIATYLTRLSWIDPVVALLISALVLRVGAQIARDAVLTLSDVSLPDDEEYILRRVLESDPSVLGYHRLRTRKAGSHRHIDVHVQIDDRHTFVQAHQFTEDLEDRLRAALPNVHPIIHIEPFEAETKHQQIAHDHDAEPIPNNGKKRAD